MPCLDAMGHQELIDIWSAFLESIFLLSPSLHLAALSATPESFFIIALSHSIYVTFLPNWPMILCRSLDRGKCYESSKN